MLPSRLSGEVAEVLPSLPPVLEFDGTIGVALRILPAPIPGVADQVTDPVPPRLEFGMSGVSPLVSAVIDEAVVLDRS
jgi:hypothetical protein